MHGNSDSLNVLRILSVIINKSINLTMLYHMNGWSRIYIDVAHQSRRWN